MREHVEVLRKAFKGEKVDYEGKTLKLKNFKLGGAIVGELPIYLGALNPQMLRMTGALCDGVILNMVPEQALKAVLGEVRAGAEEAGRDPSQIEVISRLHVVMIDDEAAGRNLVRNVFGAYAATPATTRPSSGWLSDEAKTIREKSRRRIALASRPPSSMACAMHGDRWQCRRGSPARARLRRARHRRLRAQPDRGPRRREGRAQGHTDLLGWSRAADEWRDARDELALRGEHWLEISPQKSRCTRELSSWL